MSADAEGPAVVVRRAMLETMPGTEEAERALDAADACYGRFDVEGVVTHLSAAVRASPPRATPGPAAMACARLARRSPTAWATSRPAGPGSPAARRLIADEPPCVEQGWVAVAAMGCDVDDPARLLAAAELALDRARRFGDVNLETKALADGGLAHVQAGRVAEGMALLDEAMALACGPADNTDVAGKSVCSFFTACYFAADFERADSWADLLRQRGLHRPGAAPAARSSPATATACRPRCSGARAMGRGRGRPHPRDRRLRGGHADAQLAPGHRARRPAHPPGPPGRGRGAAARQGPGHPGPAPGGPAAPGPGRSRAGPGHRPSRAARARRRPPAGRRAAHRCCRGRARAGRRSPPPRRLRRALRPRPPTSTCRRLQARPPWPGHACLAAGDDGRRRRCCSRRRSTRSSRRAARGSGPRCCSSWPSLPRARPATGAAAVLDARRRRPSWPPSTSCWPDDAALLERLAPAPRRAVRPAQLGHARARRPVVDGVVRRHQPVAAAGHQGPALRRRAGGQPGRRAPRPRPGRPGRGLSRADGVDPSTDGRSATPASCSTPRPGPPTGAGSRSCAPRSTTRSRPGSRDRPRPSRPSSTRSSPSWPRPSASEGGTAGRLGRRAGPPQRHPGAAGRDRQADRGPARGRRDARPAGAHRPVLRLRAARRRPGPLDRSVLTERDRPALNAFRAWRPMHAPRRRDRRRHLPPLHLRPRGRPDGFTFNQFLVAGRRAAAVPHRPRGHVPARGRGRRHASCPSSRCAGSRSATSRPTSAAR